LSNSKLEYAFPGRFEQHSERLLLNLDLTVITGRGMSPNIRVRQAAGRRPFDGFSLEG
jgi:hypothetical protein